MRADSTRVAGLSGKQHIIDVAELAELLRPDPPAEVPGPPEVLAEAPGEAGQACALGHENVPGARFCASCGLAMDAPAPGPVKAEGVRPRPEAELTEEEKAERDRRHSAAVAETARFEAQQPQYQQSGGAAVLIHFTEDGLTAFGQVWYRGQELEIGPDHPRWPEARGWITLSRSQQAERWGRQFFEHGPWPGRRSYTEAEGSFERLAGTDHQGNAVTIAGPGDEALRQADAAEARRNRGVPAPAFR